MKRSAQPRGWGARAAGCWLLRAGPGRPQELPGGGALLCPRCRESAQHGAGELGPGLPRRAALHCAAVLRSSCAHALGRGPEECTRGAQRRRRVWLAGARHMRMA